MRTIACAVVHDDPPLVFVAEDEETLNWVVAVQLIARSPWTELDAGVVADLRDALRAERWGDAVSLWMQTHPEIDVYPSHTLFEPRDVQLAAQELEFTPLFAE